MAPYRVVVVGMGKRGMHHAAAFAANERFELVGICDIDQKRLDDAAGKLGGPKTGTDAAALAKALKPDVFCFCTLPNLRLPLIKAGIESGAKLIAFEKPVAMTSAEGIEMKQALDRAGVKAVVSHQHRYGEHYKKVKAIIASGAIGQVTPCMARRRAGPRTCSATSSTTRPGSTTTRPAVGDGPGGGPRQAGRPARLA